MKIELSKFKIKRGKEKRAEEWMKILNDRIREVEKTLEREEMYVEAVFKEIDGEDMYLTWFSVQGENSKTVGSSEHEIDKIHVDFWRECIDDEFKANEQALQLFLLGEKFRHII